MSNLLLRQLREQGLIAGDVLPFARAKSAVDLALRCTRDTPEAPRTVIVVDGVNNGDYWVVSEEDAARLEGAGYVRYLTGDSHKKSP